MPFLRAFFRGKAAQMSLLVFGWLAKCLTGIRLING